MFLIKIQSGYTFLPPAYYISQVLLLANIISSIVIPSGSYSCVSYYQSTVLSLLYILIPTNKEGYNLQSISVTYQQLLVPYGYNCFNPLQLLTLRLHLFLKQFYFNIFSTLVRKIVSKYSLKPNIIKLLVNSAVRSPIAYPL